MMTELDLIHYEFLLDAMTWDDENLAEIAFQDMIKFKAEMAEKGLIIC